MTYAEYLKSLGATDADVAVLDTPLARKAYEAMDAAVADTKTKLTAYEAKVGEYYETTKKTTEDLQRDLLKQTAEAARARAALLKMNEMGLADVAKDLGWTPETPAAPVTPPAPKYVTLDEIAPALDGAGDGLAAVFDASQEHARLFPGVPFVARQLRAESVAARKPFYQYWEEKFKVPAARDAFNAKEKSEYEARLRKEGADAERAKLASEYANPATRPGMPSTSAFKIRKDETGKIEQPWVRSEEQNSDARVRRATENLIKRTAEGVTH